METTEKPKRDTNRAARLAVLEGVRAQGAELRAQFERAGLDPIEGLLAAGVIGLGDLGAFFGIAISDRVSRRVPSALSGSVGLRAVGE